MTVCFDLDGTLCTNTYGAYDEAEPFPWAIERLNGLAEAGHRIVVFTARGTATGIDWRETTREQLDRWGVRYDDLQLGKPSADVYVDDRAVHTTAWREGDAYAVPASACPRRRAARRRSPACWRTSAPPWLRAAGPTAAVHSWSAEHVERALAAAAAAGIAELPARGRVVFALEDALSARPDDAVDVVFSFALADPVGAGYLDLADERVHGAAGHPEVGGPGRRGPAAAAGGHRRRARRQGARARPRWPSGRGGRRHPCPGAGAGARGPTVDLARGCARRGGVATSPEPLDPAQLGRATEVFEAVSPFGLLRVAQVGDLPVATGDDVRPRLAAVLSEEMRRGCGRAVAEVLGA